MNPKAAMIVRVILGLFLLVFGLNKFLNFLPVPPLEGDGETLFAIYFSSGFMSLIGVLEVVAGVLLLVGKFVPLALTFSMAILFNGALFHVFHDPAGIGGAVLGLVLTSISIYAVKDRFKELLSS